MLGPWEKSADIFRSPTTKKEKTTDISRVAASLIEIAGEDFTIKDADRSASRTNLYRKFEWGVTMAGDARKVELQQQWHEGMSPDVEYTLTISEPGEVDDYDYRYWLRGEGSDDLGITVSEDSDAQRHYDLGKHCRKYKQSPTTHIDRIINMLSQGRQDMRYILHASDSEARTQDYYDREFAQFVLGRAVLASEAKVAKIVAPASMSEEALRLSGKISAKPSVVGILFSSAVKRAQKPYNWRLTEHALAGAITKRAQSPSERSPYFADKPASKKA